MPKKTEDFVEEEIKKPKWVNPNKDKAAEQEQARPKWVNPNKGMKQEQYPRQPRSRQWQNPKFMSYRERMDKRLERAGLLNYQTKGLSQAEIARRYAAAGISISGSSTWYKGNYGVDAPEVLTDRRKMFEYQPLARQGKLPDGLFPTLEPQITRVTPGGGTADRPTNYAFLNNGMVVKAPPPSTQTNANSPYTGQAFGTVEQAKSGQINWTDVSSADRAQVLKDPNFYASGEITKYPKWMQQQILADPNFQWKELPWWQQSYYGLSSSPAAMGAVQGFAMGLGSGNALGGSIGAIFGAGAGASGYNPTKEFWEQGGNGPVKDLAAGAFGLMNWLAEQAEKTAGMGFQAANAAVDPNKSVKDVLNKESWNAGAGFFEVITPAWIEAVNAGKGELGADDLLKVVPEVWAVTKIWDLIAHPEKYKGNEVYLGAEKKVALDKSWVERIDQAREEIKNGRNYREVMTEMQTGIVAQLGDMAGQAIADPLNVLPEMQVKVGEKIAEAGGHKVAAEALRTSEGLREAGSKYKTLVQTGQALTIDPNFKVDQMGRFSRWVAGVNEQGVVKAGSLIGTQKGLLDPITRKQGFAEDMATQTPHSRAQTGAGMFYENVSAMLQMFTDPGEAGKYLKALANNDMDTWSELGSRFAESPEFYTVLPALKEFNATQLDGIIQAWEMTAGNRDYLARVADVMGENQGTLLEDFAKHGTAEQDFARLVNKMESSTSEAAKALLAEVKDGRFTAESLKQMVDVFTGEGALPWHEGQWKAMMLDTMGEHFDKWVTQRLMLDKSPEAVSAFYRTSALMKQAQSILLLGGSPGYALTNGMSNMVHRAVSGLGGFMTPGQINKFMERFGVTPARFEEGVGIGGVVEQAAGSSAVKTSAMDEAIKGKGRLAAAKDAIGKIGRGMPFNKLSGWFEKMEGRQAFTIGMKDMWSQSWRRGVGFTKMSGELEVALRAMGQDPNRIYAAIEAGMNIAEVEKAVFGRQQEVQARSLIHDAAQRTGMSAGDAAQMLEKMGVLDVLDSYLKGQTTKDGISQAFRKAEREAQDWIDMRTGEDLKATAESVKQRVGLEGAAAALDVSMKAHGAYTDVWMDHYYRFGEVMNDLYTMPDDAARNKAVDHAYELSGQEFRRVNARNAANYKGIFDAWGLSGDPKALRALDAMGAADKAMGDAYVKMRQNWKEWRSKWGNDPKNPARWDDLDKVRAGNDRLFKDAFKAKHEAEVKQGGALGEIYESLYGPAAGEAARLWWEDVVKFNDEMVAKEREFRESINEARRTGADAADIAAEKQKYYAETKIMQIAELERINGEGIARLERVIKKGGGGGLDTATPTRPPEGPRGDGQEVASPGLPHSGTSDTSPAGTTRPADVDEMNGLMAAAEQRKAAEISGKAERVAAVWDVAEEYWGKGGNYSRGILQDRFALLNALRKTEYGGIADLFDLSDERLTPELVRQVMENRKTAKETNAAAAAEKAVSNIQSAAGRKFDTSQITQDTSILRAIALHGGIDLNLAKDLTGEVKPKSAPGVFTRRGSMKGYGIDEMARLLADDGYPIRLDDVNDPGGIQQVTDMINRARAGDKVYPMGHDFSAELNAAEAAWIEGFNLDEAPEVPFDAKLWQTEFDNAVQYADLGKVYELIGNFPDELLNNPVDPLKGTSGSRLQEGTWREFLSRTADDVAARVQEEAVTESVAGHAARAEESIRVAEDHAEAVTRRTILLESLAEAFPSEADKVGAWGEVLDATAGWYARMTGEDADGFFHRYFGEVRRADGGPQTVDDALMQQAFHGSPYKFDKFTLDHMGSGEGAQAYGWGLYFADSRKVADWYREKLAGRGSNPKYERFFKGQPLEAGTPEYHAATLVSKNGWNMPLKKAIAEMQKTIIEGRETGMPDADIADWQRTLDLLKQATSKKDFTERVAPGQLYRVELPDEGYLLWDKPLSEQPENVKEFVKRFSRDTGEYLALDDSLSGQAENIQNAVKEAARRITDEATNKLDYKEASVMSRYLDNYDWNKTGAEIYNDLVSVAGSESEVISALNVEGITLKEKMLSEKSTGSDIYELIHSDPKAASLALKDAGINGIKYLDGSSRGKGEGNFNYVIFDEAAIQVKETFYQAESHPSTTAKSASAQDGERIPGTFDKGMVTFEGVKGTITAFEKGDFSTVVHETGHIYRRMLADVAERTGSPYILRDLKAVEEWAGVKDGAWNRAAEEKFARGFEKYIAEGKAPTPGLVRAFESFKSWMLDVYRAITGSTIDVKLTDDVRRVFDRMLGAENTRIDLDNMLMQMNYDPHKWYVDPLGNIVPRPEFDLKVDAARVADEVASMDLEGMKARVEALRNRMAAGEVKPGPDRDISRTSWTTDQPDLVRQIQDERKPANWRSWASTEEPPVPVGRVRELTDWTLSEMQNAKGRMQNEALFQSEQPFGRYDEASGWRAESEGLDDGWREKVRPLLREMEAGAVEQGRSFDFGGDRASQDGARDTSPEGQAMLRKYMRQVQNEMATTKLATVRHAERQRDFALLNYSRRYGVDRLADAVMPYQFYMSRSMFTWAGRALDKPALYSNYARLKMQSERYENDLPERMRGKIKIAAPWLPEWAGGGLYIDPFKNLFFPETMVRYLQRAQQDKTYQQIEAERVMQEWMNDGTYTEKEIMEAAQSQQGKVWERAWQEAQMRRESESANPMDFFTGFFGPAWYLSTPLNLAGIKVPGISKGDPNKVSTLPLGNTARALETVTKGTWAEPAGQLFGLIGKAEDWGREKFKLPTRGEYADYYTKRQLANMVAEGKINAEQAQMAMIEKTGPLWDEAIQRVDMELALRVPLAGVTYAALHKGAAGAAQAVLPSMFGASMLPAGELEFRGLKQEWNDAWKLADAGDTKAVSNFFNEHPEYEAWLAKGKKDEDLLQSFLVGQVWDQYMELGTTNQKQARAELGQLFQQSFLDKETRSYESIPVEQLAAWAKLLGGLVPKVPSASPSTTATNASAQDGKLKLYPENVTAVTDQFFKQRTEMFPNYYEEQAGYYALGTKAEKRAYLLEHPDLKKYWDWKNGWYDAYPQYEYIFKGDAFDRVDTSGWMPGLEDIVREAALMGGGLPEGARAALYNEWLMAGGPMDDFDTWVKNVVLPGMMYGN